MNVRRKRRYRIAQRRANAPLLRICGRCNKPFSPDWMDGLNQWTRFCDPCSFLNLKENLGL